MTIPSAYVVNYDPPSKTEALVLLRAEHESVRGLFAEYAKTHSSEEKRRLVSQICAELTMHAQIEEEIFYPAVKRALNDEALVPEAIVEHATLRALVSQVEGIEPDGEMFDAKINVLAEYVQHHVREEQTEMFRKAQVTELDMEELGKRLAVRKAEIVAERHSRYPLL